MTLSVTDTGKGIAPRDLSKIFLPFWTRRADGSNGRGLGLAIVQAIVDHAGGRIVAASKLGQGSAFTVTFPDPDGPGSAAGTSHSSPGRTAFWSSEDDRPLNKLLVAQLGRLGYTAQGVESRSEALGALARFRPDLALLDLRLPDTDGLTFLLELREYCPVIILTTYGFRSIRR